MPKRDYFEKRLSVMKKERLSYISHWRELSELFYPRTGRFLTTKDTNKGRIKHNRIINNVGTMARRTLSAGMKAGITNPSRPWFRLDTPDPDMKEWGPVKNYLYEVEKILFRILAKSNFYNAVTTFYAELGVYGTNPLIQLENYDNVTRFFNMTAGTYCIATDENGIVDTLYREPTLTVRQMVRKFGYNNCSSVVRKLYDESNYEDEVSLVHSIEPNSDRVPGKQDNKNMAYRSVWYETGGDKEKLLGQSGFEERPFHAARWDVTENNTYGDSPGMDALGDNASLQMEEKEKGKAIKKGITPPMGAPADLKTGVNSLPGSVTYYKQSGGQAKIHSTHDVDARFVEILKGDIAEVADRINRAFYVDLFLMLANSDRRQITAREIDERHEEKLLMLGPVLDRLNDEFFDPTIDRTFNMAQRAGILPPPPKELDGMDLDVEYISILHQAQRAVATVGLEQTAAFVGNMASISPDALDKWDADQAIDEYADMVGVVPKVIRTDDQVKQIRQQRAQAEQQAQQAAMMDQAAQTGKTLSETPLGEDGNSVLDVLTGL